MISKVDLGSRWLLLGTGNTSYIGEMAEPETTEEPYSWKPTCSQDNVNNTNLIAWSTMNINTWNYRIIYPHKAFGLQYLTPKEVWSGFDKLATAPTGPLVYGRQRCVGCKEK